MKFGKFNNEIPPDPSKSSIREETLDLEKNEGLGNVFFDKKTGEEFFEIKKFRAAKIQKFVSLLSKGIINTVDIVKFNNRYYSHNQKLNSLKEVNEKHIEEIDADIFILWKVFNDIDKSYNKQEDSRIVYYNQWVEHGNLMLNNYQRKKYYFDFHLSYDIFFNESINFDEVIFRNQINEILKDKIINQGKDFLPILKEKIMRFLDERFNDESFFKAVIKKSSLDSDVDEQTINKAFNSLKSRLNIIYEVIVDKLEK